MQRIILVLTLGLAATGCQRIAQRFEAPTRYVAPDLPPDSCNSSEFRQYVGQPSGVLADLVFVDPVRVLGPDEAVTRDYMPLRTNFDIASDGTITRVWCG